MFAERRCSHCDNPMEDGYCIRDGEDYYCSDACLHTAYSEDDYTELYENEEAYWTEWHNTED